MTKKLLIILLTLTMFLTACYSDKSVETENKKIGYGEALDIKQDIEELKEYKGFVRKTNYENKTIRLTAVGDIMVGRRVGRILHEKGIDLAYKNLKETFNSSDILFGNLESPISNRGRKLPGKGICLRAKPEMAQVLKNSGFDIVSLANNHILDYDSEALLDTFKILKENDIAYIGAGRNIEEARKPYVMKLKGKTFAFLGYDEFAYIYYSSSYKRRFVATDNLSGTAPLKLDSIIEDVKKIREKVDYVVVSLHWGTEESNNINSTQKEIAHKLIENGVDIILGHHPHVIQPIEIYKGRPIIYSMGNYIFDQNDENNKQGMALEVLIEYGEIREVHALPIYILNKSEPIIAHGKKGDFIKNKIIEISKRLDTIGEIKGKGVTFKIK
ncbi:CapA family protein [Wukongibacter baidiensis]|uniref:CapA family protein n=1 Tax=Wukongibacter baidiensis TaxID=1723361 RepID=UPI003D7FC700